MTIPRTPRIMSTDDDYVDLASQCGAMPPSEFDGVSDDDLKEIARQKCDGDARERVMGARIEYMRRCLAPKADR